MDKDCLYIIERIYIDMPTKEEDELLLIKKINKLLQKAKPKYERLVVALCVEEVNRLNIPKEPK